MTTLFDSVRIGAMTLQNRVVMAPMTRNRANANGGPTDQMAHYYRQRASFGLIITEGTQPCAVGQGYPRTPGMYTDDHEQGWREVALQVHGSGGHIFMQLMHSGRIGHSDISSLQPVGPSAIRAHGEIFTGESTSPFPIPRAMTPNDLQDAQDSFVKAAHRAINAGLDGVEIHAANGYLLHQFLADNTNKRTDSYGGSPERRAAFVIETIEAVSKAIGASRVGIRISPGGVFNDIVESEIESTYSALLDGISGLELAYLHVATQPAFDGITFSREGWAGPLIVNTGTADQDKVGSAKRLVEEGGADLVSFARLALANPDLPLRIRESGAFNTPDPETFYSGGEIGYLDYPSLDG